MKASGKRNNIQSALSKKYIFGIGTKCDVRLLESQIRGVKKGRNQL